MKPSRTLAFILGGLGLLLLVGVAIAFSSGFQTWAARRALVSQQGWDITVTRVSAGFGSVHLEGVRVVRSGAVLTLPTLDADLPLLPAALQSRVQINRLVAKGWTLDLTHYQPLLAGRGTTAVRLREFSLLPSAYAAPASAAAFAGIFNQLQLPVDLSLAGVDLAGEVLLPALPGRRSP